MSRLDDIFTLVDGDGIEAVTTAKDEVKALMLELADQVELETNLHTGIPDALALFRQKVAEL